MKTGVPLSAAFGIRNDIMKNTPTSSQGSNKAPLNLKKFAPGPADANASGPEGDGQTMFIKKTAAQTSAQAPAQAQAPAEEAGLPHKDMLGVITYCYVRGVFSSKEIAEKLKQEPALRKSFGRNLPDEAAIKSFRRRYAAEIEDLLETVYRAYSPEDAKLAAEPGASQSEIVHREAVERLHEAAWEDTMRSHLH